jgi:hypothetical protein
LILSRKTYGLVIGLFTLGLSPLPATAADKNPVVARIVSFGGVCLNCNLAGRKLTGAQFIGANFSGAVLAGADLRGATIQGSNFAGANFMKSDLRGMQFVGADLAKAQFAGAVMAGVEAMGSNFEGANLAEVDLSGADIKAVCSEAGLLALRERRMRVKQDDFVKAKERTLYRKKGNIPEGLYL